MRKRRVTEAATVLLPFSLYLVFVTLLGRWIIDDAGISFAYARNFAAGYGLVSQPGRLPVEGFSNSLWVLVLSPFFAVGGFDPVWTPKILSAFLVSGALWLLVKVLRERTDEVFPGALTATALAVAPPIVIWSTSGLENGLLLFLVVALWGIAVTRPRGWMGSAGLVAGLIAMTRPDGLVLAGAVPSILAFEAMTARGPRLHAIRGMASNLGALAAVLGPFFLFRRVYFGLWLPHPYYAKREWASAADRLKDLFQHPGPALAKLWDLFAGIAGPAGPWIVVAVLVLGLFLLFQWKLPLHAGTAAVLFAFSAMGFVFIEKDWMGEYRFATPALAMGLLTLFSVLHAFEKALDGPTEARAVRAVSGLVLAAVALSGLPRFRAFALQPPTPYADVSRQYVQRLNAMAKALGLEEASTLLADNGATLVESRLKAYDIAGLFEPAIVRTIRKGGPVWHYDHPAFFDWVFEEVRPTFVVTLGFWTNVTALEQDPRFARDYVAVDVFRDAYVAEVYGRNLHSGEFVRKDALRNGWTVERVRTVYRPGPRPRPLLAVLEDFVRTRVGRPRSRDDLVDEALGLRRAHRSPVRAVDLLELAVGMAPADTFALSQLAMALDESGRFGEAREVWSRLADGSRLRVDPVLRAQAAMRLGAGTPSAGPLPGSSVPTSDSGRVALAQALLNESLGFYRERQYLEAIVSCRKALGIRPDYAEAYNNICASYNELGRWDEAAAACGEALRIRPDLQLARNNLAWALRERSRVAK